MDHSDMQLMAETCDILSNVFRFVPDAAAIFGRWNWGCFART
jgi:6-phosphogluconate dehydrogenase